MAWAELHGVILGSHGSVKPGTGSFGNNSSWTTALAKQGVGYEHPTVADRDPTDGPQVK